MIVVLQRVSEASVEVNNKLISSIHNGYVILLGIYQGDTEDDVIGLVEKIVNVRIMSDDKGKMNKSILETKGEILIVSQFTLCADLKYGRRPSFIKAMKPDKAEDLYNYFVLLLKKKNLPVQTGIFGEYMDVEIHNDGPVTIIINTRNSTI